MARLPIVQQLWKNTVVHYIRVHPTQESCEEFQLACLMLVEEKVRNENPPSHVYDLII